MLERVRIVEVMGRLHATHALVVKQGERVSEEIRLRHEIRIENGD